MATVGYATLDVIPSLRGAQASIDRQLAAPMAAAGRKGGAKFGDEASKSASSRLAAGFKDMAAPLAGVFAGAAIVQGFQDVVSRASAAEQAVGGVRAVFGEYAAQVEADSARAAQALGLSATAYQELVTVSGASLKNKGIQDFADQADTLVRTGADLAAQFGGSTQEAVEALNAALRGESDPIERYAISLNETAVNAQLAASGQSKLTGAALEQAKTQARLTLIQKQSADAAGAFSREADTLAGRSARLTAEWADMRTELGNNLLPALASVVGFLNDRGIPALQATGGFVSDAASAFRDLPGPVQTAAGAFLALRTSAALGLTAAAGSGARSAVSGMSGLMDTLRLRAMLATDAFRSASGSGFTSTLAGIRAGAAGAAGALRGLAVAVAPIAVITAAVTIWSKFKQGQEEAKARVDELTASLDEQKGTITEVTEAAAFKTLQDSGAIDTAKQLGIGLEELRAAALGDEEALARVNSELNKFILASGDPGLRNSDIRHQSEDAEDLRQVLNGTNSELAQARDAWRDQNTFMGKAADTTATAADAMRDYADETKDARDKLRDLMNVEKKRAEAAIQNRRDRIGIEEQLAAARKESREGKAGLDAETGFGRENMAALLDLADQFNNSTAKVRNTPGLYKDLRDEFIRLAEKMGAGEEKAKKLADQLLNVPRTAPLKFQTENFQKTMDEIAAIKRAAGLGSMSIGLTPHQTGLPAGTNPPPPRTDTGRDADDFLGGRRTGPTTIYNGPVTYTDDNEGRKRAQQRHRRAQSDGVRRP